MLEFIVMQMRKANREKGYWTPLNPITIFNYNQKAALVDLIIVIQ